MVLVVCSFIFQGFNLKEKTKVYAKRDFLCGKIILKVYQLET